MPLPPRHNIFVTLSREERRQLEKLAGAELRAKAEGRSVGNWCNAVVVSELAR